MAVFVGLDPGGAGKRNDDGNFGWCIVEGDVLPLKLTAAGCTENARGAVAAIVAALHGREPAAIGIDAPLHWVDNGGRPVDDVLRRRIIDLGAPNGTVNAVNSLVGACLIQGVMAGMLLSTRYPSVPITEAHPKASLWLLRRATKINPPQSIGTAMLAKLFDSSTASEHVRDAALSAVAAWAMWSASPDWEDIEPLSGLSLTPLPRRPAYWVPLVPRAAAS